MPVPGYDVHVVDPVTGADVPPGTTGDIVVRLPLPPGCLPTLWGDDQRFIDSYLSRTPAPTSPATADTWTATDTST